MSARFKCDPCDFVTDRQRNLDRHLVSKQHKTIVFLKSEETPLNVQEECGEGAKLDDLQCRQWQDYYQQNFSTGHDYNDGSNNTSSDESEEDVNNSSEDNYGTDSCEWHPFTSKAEMLLYIFMNSSTHPVSDGVVSFVLYMLKELGVHDLPSLKKLKEKKFGSYSWENLITKGNSDDNIPVWIMKPSEILKLSIANPNVSKKLLRSPKDACATLEHPANGRRWAELEFESTCRNNQLPVVTLPIKLFLDDTSALKSKKWMALHCVQMQLSGLPLSEMQKQGSVQFVGATEKADIMDIAAIVNEDIKKMQPDGIESFDAMSKARCVVKSCVDIIVADYAMLSYCCNHLGAASTKYCPKCYADSDHFMTIAQNRTPRETQLQIQRINLRSSEKDKKKLRKKKGVKEHRNVIWDILDPHKDIPVGMLHLIPLGLAKHLVKFIVNHCNESLVRKMDIHLQYVCPESRFQNFFKYIDSRQGKDFKDYLQVATFNMLFADVPRPLVKMVACLASIQKLLNRSAYTDQNIEDIRELIRDYHQLVYEYAPELRKKAKTHLLLHIVEDIQRHGPPKAFAEDAFEKNHGAIRNMIFLQNQKARSRDTCIKFAKQYLCMHVISGGYFEQDNNWCQATSAVIRLGLQSPVLNFLGADTHIDSTKQRPGTISLFKRDQKKKIVVENPTDDFLLQALLTLNIEDHHFDQYKLMRGSGVRAESGILIHSGEWVSYLDSEKQEFIGVFKEGLVIIPKRGAHLEVVVLWKTNILNKKVMGCQVLEKSATTTIVPSKNLEKISVVHNCSAAKCRIVEAISSDKVEQENVLKKSTHLKHNLLVNQYIVNQFYL